MLCFRSFPLAMVIATVDQVPTASKPLYNAIVQKDYLAEEGG